MGEDFLRGIPMDGWTRDPADDERDGPPEPDFADTIRAGDRVTIVDALGGKHTGRAVMRSSSGGWVLNMGGRHGTPAIAHERNTVKVVRRG